ncbi:MAG: DNA photolyase [Candidatus Marinimicrobia bacterium]|nr:DNA photolyase [Candidatus Neomarinimicrobiota bacterium]
MEFHQRYYDNITSHSGSKIILNEFIAQKLTDYKKERNFDYSSFQKNFVSGLSPAISRRIITEEMIVNMISASFLYNNVEKFIDEICWRAYWKGWLEHRPNVWDDYLSDLKVLELKNKKFSIYKKVINGKTNLDCFNHWVHDLKTYGYLHNHTRMWFASLWVFYFEIPWQLGAEFFYKNLIDADPASNTLSWRWVAGLQTRGKTYVTSKENIDKFTNNRFDFPPDFHVEKKYIDDKKIYDPVPIQRMELLDENMSTGYLIYEEDLSLFNIKKNLPIIIQSKSYNPYRQEKLPLKISNECLKNTIQKCKTSYSKNITTFTWDKPEIIKNWTLKNNISQIELSSPAVGKYKYMIPQVMKRLNLEYSYVYHDWDLLLWKYSDRGFFKLKKNIKKVISSFWEEPLFRNN